MSMSYNFIAIEGNIGVGKTTLAKKLSKDYRSRLILEEFSNNPFLSDFYNSPEKNAFSLELFFMAERYYQLNKNKEYDLFHPITFSDYFFIKSKIFAQNNLTSNELNLFNRLFDIMLPSVIKPDCILYLYSSIFNLQKNIFHRGRDYEQNISSKYLQDIQERYLDYFKKQKDYPVLLLDVTDIDFVHNHVMYEKIKESIMQREYKIGINQITIK